MFDINSDTSSEAYPEKFIIAGLNETRLREVSLWNIKHPTFFGLYAKSFINSVSGLGPNNFITRKQRDYLMKLHDQVEEEKAFKRALKPMEMISMAELDPQGLHKRLEQAIREVAVAKGVLESVKAQEERQLKKQFGHAALYSTRKNPFAQEEKRAAILDGVIKLPVLPARAWKAFNALWAPWTL
jgi:hypothetical protein